MSSKLGPVLTRFLPPIFFAALALFYLSHRNGFNDPTSAQAPTLYGRAMLIMAVLVLTTTLVRLKTQTRKPDEEEADARKIMLIFAILAGFVALVFAMGFYAAIPLFLLFFFLIFARMKIWFALIWALAASTLVWGIFGQLLHMRVFIGYLLR